MRKISIVFPAYNEEKRIRKTLNAYLIFFKNFKKKKLLDFDIIIVLNGCIDNTRGIVEEYKCKELKIIEFKRNGKGFATVEGFKEAFKGNSDFIGFVDVDFSTPPKSFYDLFVAIKDCDGVIANRWDKYSIVQPKRSTARQVFSVGFNFGVRSLFLFNHRDTQCGAKLFKRELIEKIHSKLGASEWSFDVDLLFYARREKAKIKSIPTIWIDQTGSHINYRRSPITMALSSIRLRLIHSPLRFVVKAYRLLPNKLKFH